MPTTVLTGRDVTLEVDGKTHDSQTKSAELTIELDRQEHETLAGRVYATVDETGQLDWTFLSDWGTPDGICAALWQAADTAPDDPVAFTMEVKGDSWTGQVLPEKPPAGGQGKDATEVSMTLTVVGKPSRTAAPTGG